MGPVEILLKEKLRLGLTPDLLDVTNESYMHSVPPNSETHFKVVSVSSLFDKKRQVQRHQLVYGLLADELAGEVHALALHTYSPNEWSEADQQIPSSPNCMSKPA